MQKNKTHVEKEWPEQIFNHRIKSFTALIIDAS